MSILRFASRGASAPHSSLRQKFRGVDEAPEDVLESFVAVVDVAKKAAAGGQLLAAGRPSQGALVEGDDQVLVVQLFVERFGQEGLALGGDVGVDQDAVHQQQGLGDGALD